LNTTVDLPLPLPIKVYLNLATFDDAGSYLNNGSIFYETGFKIRIANNALSIYFPVFYSSEIDDIADLNNHYDNYGQKIRFSINLNQLNPFTLPKQIMYF